MFRKLPEQQSKQMSWLVVLAWTVVIFITIPLARTIQREFERLFGSGGYFIAAGIIGVFFFLFVLIYIYRRRKVNISHRLGWFIALIIASVWLMKFQLQTPAEAIHFFEYGILSFFLFRACSHHVRDWLIYPISVFLLIMIASADEFLQWMMPGRYWDFRDIRLNLLAGMIVQAFIALVVRPSGIKISVEPKSVRRLCYIALFTILVLGLAFSNTPSRVDLYATRVPFLHFLSSNESVMSEFGFRHFDSEIGKFYSRFSMRDLQRIDRERGAAVGETILKYQSFLDYHEFIQTFSSTVDPFLHEMRVHLYRRDHYYDTAWQYQDQDREQFKLNMTVAYRENQLLEKYFPMSLVSSRSVLTEEAYRKVLRFADKQSVYTSPVSDHLVTVATEYEFRLILGILVMGVGVIYARYGRERSKPLN